MQTVTACYIPISTHMAWLFAYGPQTASLPLSGLGRLLPSLGRPVDHRAANDE